ncbi:hypothetical protein BDV98DRAFT_571357 [Pterulicium gracile]|uniref:Uncharacterized protein n=1 Tax=Pterulicium gracile TaxID=1884261 RepID=A0A5C3QB45_9AGAR|nr:hypothetical protein BDV98DRAFT_571357 [Pterula gracilis]
MTTSAGLPAVCAFAGIGVPNVQFRHRFRLHLSAVQHRFRLNPIAFSCNCVLLPLCGTRFCTLSLCHLTTSYSVL